LESKVYIYNFADLKLLDQIDTYPNPKGLCAMSPSSETLVMAVPGTQAGYVRVDVVLLNNNNNNNNNNKPISHLIRAHSNPIHLIVLDLQGKRLATCSVKGTLIRIYDTHKGELIKEFRRGAQQANIQSLSFNHDGSMLCVTSDKGTVHLFVISGEEQQTVNRQSSFSFMKSIIPIAGSQWSFASFSVNESQSICAFGQNNSVLILGSSGTYYKYSISVEKDNKVICKEELRDIYFKRTDEE